jgi:hypothetical protein
VLSEWKSARPSTIEYVEFISSLRLSLRAGPRCSKPAASDSGRHGRSVGHDPVKTQWTAITRTGKESVGPEPSELRPSMTSTLQATVQCSHCASHCEPDHAAPSPLLRTPVSTGTASGISQLKPRSRPAKSKQRKCTASVMHTIRFLHKELCTRHLLFHRRPRLCRQSQL